VPEWRTGIKLTPFRAFVASTLLFWFIRIIAAARDGRDPFEAEVFLGSVVIGVVMTIIFWGLGVWRSR